MTKKFTRKKIFEDEFALQLRAYKIPYFVREHRFSAERQWRFDFAYPRRKIAIEIDGGIFGKKSGHNTGVGILNKMEKMNAANALGWTVFSFSTDQVKNGYAVRYINDYLTRLCNFSEDNGK